MLRLSRSPLSVETGRGPGFEPQLRLGFLEEEIPYAVFTGIPVVVGNHHQVSGIDCEVYAKDLVG